MPIYLQADDVIKHFGAVRDEEDASKLSLRLPGPVVVHRCEDNREVTLEPTLCLKESPDGDLIRADRHKLVYMDGKGLLNEVFDRGLACGRADAQAALVRKAIEAHQDSLAWQNKRLFDNLYALGAVLFLLTGAVCLWRVLFSS